MERATSAYVGIDLAIAKGKHLPVAICTWREGRLVPERLRALPLRPPKGRGNAAILEAAQIQEFVGEAAEYVSAAAGMLGLRIASIAIDAPSAPRDEAAPRRAAEAALDAANISCFTTPSRGEFEVIREKVRLHLARGGALSRAPHSNQLWMLVGFSLFKGLAEIAPCREVYPQATARVLGAATVHKSQKEGLDAQLRAVATHTGWPSNRADDPSFEEIAFAPGHDRLDAYLSAWVAALDETDLISFGVPPSDVIWAPRLGSPGAFPVPVRLPKAAPKRVPRPAGRRDPEGAHERLCPACSEHLFKRWPFGWDAHAAHRCSALEATEPQERKREFRRRFLG